MPQKPDRRASSPRPSPKRKKKGRALVFTAILLLLFLVALLVSRLASPSEVERMTSSVASLPVSSVPPPPSSTPPLGPYDEAEMPMLLNRHRHLPEGYDPELADVGYANGRQQQMEARAAAAFIDMQTAAAEDTILLSPFSCYRNHAHQVANYNKSIQHYLGQGYSQEKAVALTEQYYAIPGTSEHEAGFAVDINGIQASFENTPAFDWLQLYAAEYGFILRYGKFEEPITAISYEPWHYRYVGANHAKAIVEAGITLEEYTGDVPIQQRDSSGQLVDGGVGTGNGGSNKQNSSSASNARSASSSKEHTIGDSKTTVITSTTGRGSPAASSKGGITVTSSSQDNLPAMG